MKQLPTLLQQAPRSAAHGSGKQVVPAPRKLLEPTQPVPIVSEQKPDPLQQAPSRALHGVGAGEQLVPAPAKVPLQPRATVIVQEPEGVAAAWVPRQHAPRSGEQGLLGEHVEPMPLNVLNAEAWQPAAVVIVQEDEPFGQQAPVRAAQGVAAQVVPLPR